MQRIRLGMVGGGERGKTGLIHRLASRIDDRYRLVAGVLSSDPERAKRAAQRCGLARSYTDFSTMAQEEGARQDGIEAVTIVAPIHLHCRVAQLFIEQGIHVICNRPLSHSSQEAVEFAQFLKKHPQTYFVLTHNYSAYPLIRKMRYMIAEGALGNIQRFDGRYLQEQRYSEPRIDSWHSNPGHAGQVDCLGDIGSHLVHLTEFVLQDRMSCVIAQLDNFHSAHKLGVDAQLLTRTRSGVQGMLWINRNAHKACIGHHNDIRIAVYGSEGSLSWRQEEPNILSYSALGKPTQLIKPHSAHHGVDASACRIAPTYPEGYFEAFAEIYRQTADKIQARADPATDCLPGIEDALSSMALFEAACKSHHDGSVWTELPQWSVQSLPLS